MYEPAVSPTRTLRRVQLLIVAISCVLFGVAERPRAQPTYTIKDLGTLGDVVAKGMAISERGHVAGWSYLNVNEYHAFVWHEDWGMIDLARWAAPRLTRMP